MSTAAIALSAADSLLAIDALLKGEWDNPVLMAVGPLPVDRLDVVQLIVQRALDGEVSAVERARLACVAVEGMEPAQLRTATPGKFTAALSVCQCLMTSPDLQGFNAEQDDDDDVSGGDAVSVLGELWETIREAAGTVKSTEEGAQR
ncbi:hypothetical protein IMW82_13330 [Rhodanobacter sp. B2A1Ga4]|uniref:hypothetical protein n=1 Tax=Rhodanobacter sp. B2A1Ga4 TaxID=2778647 RepID=UPI001B37BAF8|nr:hypothetical protein [Rhodanobacter sp. B2A1Ga4]MBQ4855654.1 hypothetical protein [Rhodanobacter sp. B2A1Ga4]